MPYQLVLSFLLSCRILLQPLNNLVLLTTIPEPCQFFRKLWCFAILVRNHFASRSTQSYQRFSSSVSLHFYFTHLRLAALYLLHTSALPISNSSSMILGICSHQNQLRQLGVFSSCHDLAQFSCRQPCVLATYARPCHYSHAHIRF